MRKVIFSLKTTSSSYPLRRVSLLLTRHLYPYLFRKWSGTDRKCTLDVFVAEKLLLGWRRWLKRAVFQKNKFFKTEASQTWASSPLHGFIDRRQPANFAPWASLTGPVTYEECYNCRPSMCWASVVPAKETIWSDLKSLHMRCSKRPCPFCHFRKAMGMVKKWLRKLRYLPDTGRLLLYQSEFSLNYDTAAGVDDLKAISKKVRSTSQLIRENGALGIGVSLQPLIRKDRSDIFIRVRWLVLANSKNLCSSMENMSLIGDTGSRPKNTVVMLGRLLSRPRSGLIHSSLNVQTWNLLNAANFRSLAELGMFSGRKRSGRKKR